MAFCAFSLPRDSGACDQNVLHLVRKINKPLLPLSLGVSGDLKRRVSSCLSGEENAFRAVSLVVSRWRCGALVLGEERKEKKKKTRDLKMSYEKISAHQSDHLSQILVSGKWRRRNTQRIVGSLRRKCEIMEPAWTARCSDSARAEEPLPAGRGGAWANFVPAHWRDPDEKSQITVMVLVTSEKDAISRYRPRTSQPIGTLHIESTADAVSLYRPQTAQPIAALHIESAANQNAVL